MTITIETNDGATFSGRTDKEVVSRMRRSMWSAPDRKYEYMEQVANDVAGIYGAVVRTDSPTNFLNDLESAKLIVRHASN